MVYSYRRVPVLSFVVSEQSNRRLPLYPVKMFEAVSQPFVCQLGCWSRLIARKDPPSTPEAFFLLDEFI